jgi:class 3 adenylate cyclase/tetratricopeptide (TPR) repeat protein
VTALRSGTWTVLFVDVVGSTELRSTLGDAEADALQARLDDLVARVTADHGGIVVKGLGDGSMCAFEGAAGAVSGAVAIQQAVHRLSRRAPEPVKVRVGLAVGDAAAEGDDLFGTPVVEAARLCAKADAGQVLCTQVTQVVAGSRTGCEFAPVGALELKGLPDPVMAAEVLWTPLEDDEDSAAVDLMPLPRLLMSTHRVPFAGHVAELAALEKAWQIATGGERATVLLAGEPGIGKSRLAAELGRQAHTEGATVLFGRCDDELGVPFQPFVEALDFLVEHCPPEHLPDRLGPLPEELSRLVPGIAQRLPDLPPPLRSDPENERIRLFDAVDGWLAALSAAGPVMLVLDDLHWAARPTLQVLKHVIRSAATGPLLIVGTYRDTDLDRASPLTEVLADLRRIPSVQRVSVGGLALDEIVQLMELAAGHEMDEQGRQVAQAIHEESEGNAFFVGEILRHLAESGAIFADEDGRWTTRGDPGELGIPEGVREVVGRRIDQLPSDAGDVLQLAAVIGRDFELDVLLELSEAGEDDLIEALDQCAEARLVDETGVGRYRFAHALVRSTLYDELRTTRRSRLHRRVGEAIETVHADDIEAHLPELAHHFAQAAVGDSPKAFDYAVRAGERALELLAHDEAVERFASALELVEDDEHEVEVLLGLGRAQAAAGHPDYRATLIEAGRRAQAIGDSATLTQAALAIDRGYFSTFGQVDEERLTLIEAALESEGDADSPMRARLLAGLATELLFAQPLARRQEVSDEALAIARRLDDPTTLAHVLRLRHNAIWDVSTLEERIRNTDELGGLAQQDPQVQFWVGWNRAATGFEAGDRARTDSGLATCARIAAEANLAIHHWITAFSAGGDEFLRGCLDESERRITESLEIGSAAGEPDAFFYYGTCLFMIRREQGRLAEIDDLTRESIDNLPGVRSLRAMVGLLHLELGRPEDARRELERVSDGGFGSIPRDQVWSSCALVTSELCVRLGDQDRAADVLTLVEPVQDAVAYNGLVPLGSLAWAAARCHATLGRTEDADRGFAQAVEVHDRLEGRGVQARCLLEWAEALRETDPGRSAELSSRARRQAEELGLTAVAERAGALG